MCEGRDGGNPPSNAPWLGRRRKKAPGWGQRQRETTPPAAAALNLALNPSHPPLSLLAQAASALLAPHDRVAAWLAASSFDAPPPPFPTASPGAGGGGDGAAARPDQPSPPSPAHAASPFAAHAAAPFVDSPARPVGELKGCDQVAGDAGGPDSPPPAQLARLPNAAARAAWAFSDGGGSGWGCNSSDSDWMRPGPAPGARCKAGRDGGGPPPEGVLLPWDL